MRPPKRYHQSLEDAVSPPLTGLHDQLTSVDLIVVSC